MQVYLRKNAENDFIKTKRQFLRMVDYYKLPEEINLRFDNFIKNATYFLFFSY